VLVARIACAADVGVARIYGGVATNAYPAVVALDITSAGGAVVQCSGSLIAPTVVLTAGHCLSFGPSAAVVSVIPDGVHVVRYGAIGWAVNPRFDFDVAAVADAAIVVLAVPVLDVDPFPLAAVSPRPRTTATIVGFGDDASGVSGVKRAGTVILRRCPRAMPRIGIHRGQLAESLCWRPRRSLPDTCQGDSGGPLLVDGVLAGVTSGGFPNCPGVVSWDTDVAQLRPWLDAALIDAGVESP